MTLTPADRQWLDTCVKCLHKGNDCVLDGGLHWCPKCHHEYMLAVWRYRAEHPPLHTPDIGSDVPGGGAV